MEYGVLKFWLSTHANTPHSNFILPRQLKCSPAALRKLEFQRECQEASWQKFYRRTRYAAAWTGRLKGKVAIITGANSGIGRATARLFGREGAKVVCCDIQETISPRIDQLIKDKEGGDALFLQCDVTKQEDLDNAVKSAVDQFGRVDILYNNAGAGIRKKIHEHTDEEWNFVLNTNLNAMFRGARAVMPHFIKQKSGNMVTTASTFGLLASPEYPGYCATKAAIINLTREMALDYGPLGIRLTASAPAPSKRRASAVFHPNRRSAKA